MSGEDAKLLLRLGPGPHLVSTLSSLLRSLQAAVREAAASTAAGAGKLGEHSGPSLIAEVHPGGGHGVEVEFCFASAEGEVADELSRSAFGAFMVRVESALAAAPQRTLWGTPSRAGGASAGSERVRQFLDDLSRVGEAELSAGSRKIVLREGSVWIDE